MDILTNPRSQLIAGLVVGAGLIALLIRLITRRLSRKHTEHATQDDHLKHALLWGGAGPLTLFVWIAAGWGIAHLVLTSEWVPAEWHSADRFVWKAALISLLIPFAWFISRATRALERWLSQAAQRTQSRIDDVVLPLIGTAVRMLSPLLFLFLAVRLLSLPTELEPVINKVIAITLIVAITWILRRGIVLLDAALIGTRTPRTLEERAVFTRVRVMRKIAISIVTVFAVSAVLMTFDEVRDVGRSLLASAGIAGIVIGFAAQRSLGNLFAGLQIALTQPMRIGDNVIVEGDFGTVEEITLTYVVVCTWDQRRIILPISYFIEKPFQNWTRVPSNMLSPMTLRLDFSFPVAELRDFLQKEIAKSRFWDGKVFGVQVTNADHTSMEIRALGSAADSGGAFNLHCELREKAIAFVQKNYPQCLPKMRREQQTVAIEAPRISDEKIPKAENV
ncbi:MAG: mechanosensitive ion channel [Nibricoccus sp.]